MKNDENGTYFTRIAEFSKNYWKNLKFSVEPYKSRESPDEFYYLVEKFIKKLKNGLNREGILEMGWKFLKFLEKIDWSLLKNERSSTFQEIFPSGMEK